jgi:TPR repeat protein
MPPAARFCPRCGFDLDVGPADELVDTTAIPLATVQAEPSPQPAPAQSAPPAQEEESLPPFVPLSDFTPAIVKGYSNALYQLGCRYESGAGGAGNANEAIRCYRKAARLGHMRAFARLAARWIADTTKNSTQP